MNQNISRGKDAEFDARVDKTNQYLWNHVAKLTVENTVSLKAFLSDPDRDEKLPIFLELRELSGNLVSLQLALQPNDVMGVYPNVQLTKDGPVRFSQEVIYVQKTKTASMIQVYSNAGLREMNNNHPVRIENITTVTSISNQAFLNALLGHAQVTHYHCNEMMTINLVGKALVTKSTMHNSILFKLTKLGEGYTTSVVTFADQVEDAIYIRLQYSRNEISIYSADTNACLEFLKWVEHNWDASFFIHPLSRRGSVVSSNQFVVCPMLDHLLPA